MHKQLDVKAAIHYATGYMQHVAYNMLHTTWHAY